MVPVNCQNGDGGGSWVGDEKYRCWASKPPSSIMSDESVFRGHQELTISGLQVLEGPVERGHVKKRQKSSKSVKKFFDTFRQFSRRAKNIKNRQKVSKHFSTLFDTFRAAPFSRPLLGGSELANSLASLTGCQVVACGCG